MANVRLAASAVPSRASSIGGVAPGRATGSSATTFRLLPGAAAGATTSVAALSAGLTRPNRIISATSTRAAGVAAVRSRSITQSCCQIGTSAGLGMASTLNGALISFTESPRSLLKPIASCTSAVSFSTSSADSGVLLVLPLGAVTTRWFTTTAAFRRLTLPVELRVTRTVLSSS